MSLRLFLPSTLAACSLVLASPGLALGAGAPAPLPGPGLGLWGQPGVVLVPTGQCHRPGAVSFGLGALYWQGQSVPTGQASIGLAEGLEVGLNYGLPSGGPLPGLAGHARWQLVRPSQANPTAVALGLSLVGAGLPNGALEGPQLFLAATRDLNWTFQGQPYTLASLSLGAMGLPLEGGRMVGALELPLGEWGGLGLEALGPTLARGGAVNGVLRWRPALGWELKLTNLGRPGGALWDREWGFHASTHFGRLWPPTLSQEEGPSLAEGPSPTPPRPPLPTSTPRPMLAQEVPAPPSPEPAGSASPWVNPGPLPSLTPLVGGWASPQPWGPQPGQAGWTQAPPPAPALASPLPKPSPLAYAGLQGRLEGPSSFLGASVQLVGPQGALAMTPDLAGRFQALALPAGRYLVKAWMPGHALSQGEWQLSPGALAQVRLRLSPLPPPPSTAPVVLAPRPQPSAKASALPTPLPPPRPLGRPGELRGVVLGPGGRPLAGAKVAIEGPELALLTQTGPDGSFLATDLPRGRYALTVTSPGLTSQRGSALLGSQGSAPLRFVLARP